MAADERPTIPSTQLADAIGFGFQNIIEGLRTDVREDIRELRDELGRSEGRVTAKVAELDTRIAAVGTDWHQFTLDHAGEHVAEAEERRQAHGLFYDFIRHAELDAARRDGALGVVRFLIEKLGASAPRLIALILAIATAVLTVTGQFRIVVGG